MAEEYCWGITETKGRSRCARSRSGVFECAVVQMDSLKYIFGHIHRPPYSVNPARFGECLYAFNKNFGPMMAQGKKFQINAGNVLFHITSSVEGICDPVALITFTCTLCVRTLASFRVFEHLCKLM